jgi:hypothetical protein
MVLHTEQRVMECRAFLVPLTIYSQQLSAHIHSIIYNERTIFKFPT